MQYKNNSNYDGLINEAGKKTGVDPNALKSTIDAGKLDDLLGKMNPNDAKKFQEIINNKELFDKVINSPQAKLLMKQFIK